MASTSVCPICLARAGGTEDACPRILPCRHSLCTACMAKLLTRSLGEARCPMDNREVKAASVDDVPKNFALLEVLQVQESQMRHGHAAQSGKSALQKNDVLNRDAHASGGAHCDLCVGHKEAATHYCPQCEQSMCGANIRLHGQMAR